MVCVQNLVLFVRTTPKTFNCSIMTRSWDIADSFLSNARRSKHAIHGKGTFRSDEIECQNIVCFQIRDLVARIGVQRTEYLLNTRRYRANPEGAHVASMPQTRCTFLGYEYMLEPGTQDHPDNLTNPVLRNPTLTTIVPSDGRWIS